MAVEQKGIHQSLFPQREFNLYKLKGALEISTHDAKNDKQQRLRLNLPLETPQFDSLLNHYRFCMNEPSEANPCTKEGISF